LSYVVSLLIDHPVFGIEVRKKLKLIDFSETNLRHYHPLTSWIPFRYTEKIRQSSPDRTQNSTDR
jgi:hypothetical protein